MTSALGGAGRDASPRRPRTARSAVPTTRRERIRRFLRLGLVLAVTSPIFCEWRVQRSAAGRCYADAAEVPHHRAAVVLGTGRMMAGGRLNTFFTTRVRAAAELFKAGKIDYLIVSGDNGHQGYDEPSDLKRDLIAAGVPSDRIYCDYAGFRTLDSVVRAKQVFGQDSFVVVSQRFHNERAVFLARAHGIDAVAFNAADVPGRNGLRARAREVLARAAAVLDVYVLHRGPRFLGSPVKLGVDPAPDV